MRGAAGKNNSVIVFKKLRSLDVFADVYVGFKFNALFFHNVDFAVNNTFFKLHIGNTVHKQSAHTVASFKYGYRVTPEVKLVSCGKSGRTRTDDGNLFACANLWRLGAGIALNIRILYNAVFVGFNGYRVSVCSAGAGFFTKRRANS